MDSKPDQDAQGPVLFIRLQLAESCFHRQEQQWSAPDTTVSEAIYKKS